MTEKRFVVDKFIEDYKSHIIDNDGKIKTLSEFVEYLNKLTEENNEIKQLIHTMLVQMEIEKINTENVRYWAGIIFTFEEFQKMREIWKGDFE